jgi:mRNA interferase MazF
MKIRPAVVLSTELYHRHRPDVIVALITTQRPKEVAPTDCELRDWQQAGLHQQSFFRLFPVTLLQREVRLIGRLSESDWRSVRECFKAGLGSD